MLCGNCPQLSWPDGAPVDWKPRAQCCMEEAREIEARGDVTFADVVDTSLPPLNRHERRAMAKRGRGR